MGFAVIPRWCLFFLVCTLNDICAQTTEELDRVEARKQGVIQEALKSSELNTLIDSVSALQAKCNAFMESIQENLAALDVDKVKSTTRKSRKYFRQIKERIKSHPNAFGENGPLLTEALIANEADVHLLQRSLHRMLYMIRRLKVESNYVNEYMASYESSKMTLEQEVGIVLGGQDALDFCLFPVCGRHGRCVSGEGSFCQCRPFYTGKHCDTKTEQKCPRKCYGTIGLEPAHCVINSGFQTCACPDQLIGDLVCIEINPPPQWFDPPQKTECPSSVICKGLVNGSLPSCFLLNTNGLIVCQCPDEYPDIDPDTGEPYQCVTGEGVSPGTWQLPPPPPPLTVDDVQLQR